MSLSYVIVMQSDDGMTADMDIVFNDDVHAIVAARRLFVQEIITTQHQPISLTVGRTGGDGVILWLSAWTASAPAAPETAPSPWRSARKAPARRGARTRARAAPLRPARES